MASIHLSEHPAWCLAIQEPIDGQLISALPTLKFSLPIRFHGAGSLGHVERAPVKLIEGALTLSISRKVLCS
jgi:hypothetical protein